MNRLWCRHCNAITRQPLAQLVELRIPQTSNVFQVEFKRLHITGSTYSDCVVDLVVAGI